MKGVLLVNMGGPGSPEELKSFLARMFRDPAILPYNRLVRTLLSFLISRSRYKKSWKKYELIGGTPLVEATRQTAVALQSVLGNSHVVKYAFSYSSPDIGEVMLEYKKTGISEIVVIPLYPQSSHTTTSSVKCDLRKVTDKDSFFKVQLVEEFYDHPGFIDFWIRNIKQHIREQGIQEPTLIFSAHSIPEYCVRKGDTYPSAILRSAASIATALGMHYEAAYQSGMKRGSWIGPEVKEHLRTLSEEGIDNLVVVPISFVHENLETRYDLDHDLIPYARNVLGITNITRVQLPETDLLLSNLLADLVLRS